MPDCELGVDTWCKQLCMPRSWWTGGAREILLEVNATNGAETLITTTLPPPPVQTVIETEIELSVENATSLDVKSIAAVAQEIVAQTSGEVEDVETDVTVSFEVKASVTLKGLTSEQFETNKDVAE